MFSSINDSKLLKSINLSNAIVVTANPFELIIFPCYYTFHLMKHFFLLLNQHLSFDPSSFVEDITYSILNARSTRMMVVVLDMVGILGGWFFILRERKYKNIVT